MIYINKLNVPFKILLFTFLRNYPEILLQRSGEKGNIW